MRATFGRIAAISSAFSLARGFSFTTSNPTQCGDFQINWTGGQAPFVLGIFPAFGGQAATSVPAAAVSNGQGTFTTKINLPESQRFLVTMSDATGFASGGISEVLTVGAAASGANCNATVPSPDWQYDLNTALQQCRPYTFGPYTDPVQPVTVYGLVPGGNLLTLPLPVGPTFTWSAASIKAGTTVMFALFDSKNRTGGASDLYTVGLSDDATCLNGQSPSSTVQPTSSTAAPVTGSATSSSSPTALPSASRNISYGTVAAVIIGGLIGLAAIGGLVVFLMRQRKKESSPFYSKQGHIDLDDGHETPALLPSRYQAEPFTLTTPTPYELATLDSTTNLISNANDDRNASVSSASALPRKGQSGDARYQPARFILHTDAEEINPDENGVVELPPQYSAARRPLPGAPQQSTTSNPFESPDPRPP